MQVRSQRINDLVKDVSDLLSGEANEQRSGVRAACKIRFTNADPIVRLQSKEAVFGCPKPNAQQHQNAEKPRPSTQKPFNKQHRPPPGNTIKHAEPERLCTGVLSVAATLRLLKCHYAAGKVCFTTIDEASSSGHRSQFAIPRRTATHADVCRRMPRRTGTSHANVNHKD